MYLSWVVEKLKKVPELQEKGKQIFIRLVSASDTISREAKWRFCLRFLLAAKWRRPALLRFSFPEAVSVKRLDTAFFVLEVGPFLINRLF